MLLNSKKKKKRRRKKKCKGRNTQRDLPEKDFSDINGSKKWHPGMDTHLGATRP